MTNASRVSGRGLDRLINFTDAVVAVAITVLVLPLAGLGFDQEQTSIWEILVDNSGLIFSYFFTFFIVGWMWLTHNRILNDLESFDTTIFWLNLFWLSAIAFLPVSSSIFGTSAPEGGHGWSGGSAIDGSGLLYWGSLAAVAGLGSLIVFHIRRNPELLKTDLSKYQGYQASLPARIKFRGPIFTLYFLSTGLVSLVSSPTASLMAIGLFPLSVITRYQPKKQSKGSEQNSQEDRHT